MITPVPSLGSTRIPQTMLHNVSSIVYSYLQNRQKYPTLRCIVPVASSSKYLPLFHQPIFFFIQKQNNQDQGRKLLLLGATGLTHQQYYACILNLLSSEVNRCCV